MNDTNSGIKRITNANWQQMDDTTRILLQMTSVAKNEHEWVLKYLHPTLHANVPKSIAQLLEVARGAMIYGWYFYPLATLGVEQCWRILEAGAREKCRQAGIPIKRLVKNGPRKGRFQETTFNENIDALVKSGIIVKKDEARWKAAKALRNFASHPAGQSIYDSWEALGKLELCVKFLNDLF